MRAKAGKYAPLFPENHQIKLGEGIVGSVAQSGEMILTNQATEDVNYKNYFPELLDTISETAMPAPIVLHNCLKGRSVTPAIGATISLFFKMCVPICM